MTDPFLNPGRPQRRLLLRAALAAGAACCWPLARACEFTTPTLRVLHPWARASAPGATDAIVCMVFDQVHAVDRLIGVQTPVAGGAELGDGPVDFVIPQGQESVLGETGRVLRLVDLAHPLEVGREYPLRLLFDKGGAVNATLSIDYARFS